MRLRLILILVLVSTLHLSCFAQITLTIEISSLRSSKGQILLELYDGNKNVLTGVKEGIKNNKCVILIKDLKPGKYAFRYFHDENSNSKLDTNWMGIPNEGFGFSNNVLGRFGPPAFEKWIFELDVDKKVSCSAKYM